MTKENENKIKELLTKLCRWAKNNCNGGRVFDMELDSAVRVVINKVLEILNEK